MLSKCGRDKGKAMVIIGLDKETDAQYVFLADGLLRTLERPKKKKIKHIQPTHYKVDLVIPDGRALQDADIRKQLKAIFQTQ